MTEPEPSPEGRAAAGVPAGEGAAGAGAAPELSVVLPVYNEEACLERNLAELLAFLPGLGRSFEVVAVDDGSRDRSGAILAAFAAREPRLRALALPQNRGKGAAVRHGVLASRGLVVVFMDADLSTPLEELHGFLGALDSGYQVVLGNRRAPGARIERRQPWIRQTLGKGFTLLTRTLLAPGVQDFTCGFKAFERRAALTIFQRSTLNGWAFDAELVVIASVQGCKLAQVPVRWHHEDRSKVRLLGAVLGSARDLLRIAGKRLRGDYA
jgi:dolichyl-phosphate beta-glucosyltransferase